jgi:hypothetical protein
VFNIRRKLLAECGGILGAQVDLVVGASKAKPHRLLGPGRRSDRPSSTTITFWAISYLRLSNGARNLP